MKDIPVALREVVALLRSTGMQADIDPSKVNPPAAWVHADTATIDMLDHGATLACFIDLVVPARSIPIALGELQQLLNKALTVITPDGPIELDRGVELTNNKMLPAYRIPLNIHI